MRRTLLYVIYFFSTPLLFSPLQGATFNRLIHTNRSSKCYFPSFKKELSLIENIDNVVESTPLLRIKTLILSLFIGEDDLKYTISVYPKSPVKVNQEIIMNPLKAELEAEEKDSEQTKTRPLLTTLNLNSWMEELIINKDNFLVSQWNNKQKTVDSFRACYNPLHKTLESVITKNSYESTSCIDSADTISIIRYNCSFGLYNFNTRTLKLINDATRKKTKYTIKDFASCYASSNNKWLWDLSCQDDSGYYPIKRYNLETHACDEAEISYENKQLLRKLLIYTCASSEKGSTFASYFPKKYSEPKYQQYLIVWSNINPQVKSAIKLEGKPHNTKISACGNYLVYEHKLGNIIKLHFVNLRSPFPTPPTIQYTFEFPLMWKMTETGENIIAMHGKRKISFINPHLHVHHTIYLQKPWNALPSVSLSPRAEGLVCASYVQSVSTDTTKVVEITTLIPHVVFTKLEKINLKNNTLSTIKCAYRLFRDLSIDNDKAVIALRKGERKHADFLKLPKSLQHFFLTSYPERLNIEGEHTTLPKLQTSWNHVFNSNIELRLKTKTNRST